MSLWTKDGRQVSGFPQAPKRQTPPTFGQAQPIQPPPTPYGQPQQQPARPATTPAPRAQDFSVYRPQQAQGNPFAQYNPQQMGNFVQQMSGLPSFQFSATDSFGNTYDNPAALTAQQGAMAQALNAQRGQQIQSGNIGQLNPMAAYQQAQNMVQGGWTNPFAQPNSQQIGTMGGPPSDPRWSHNGGQWQSGQAQPIQPPSQGTRYGTPPDQRGMGRTNQFIDGDGDGVDDRDQDGPGMPRYGAPPRRGGFERDAVGMPILRAPNDPSNPTRPMPQPWITTNFGGRVLSMPPRPATPRRQPFFY